MMLGYRWQDAPSRRRILPPFSTDFIVPHCDIVDLDFRPDMGKNSNDRLYLRRGNLTIVQYGSEDTRLAHEIGHLLTRSTDIWWQPRYIPEPINFAFSIPTTMRGTFQLCENEIAATAIENVIIETYTYSYPVNNFCTQLREYCEHFGFVDRTGMNLNWIRKRYDEYQKKTTIHTILTDWTKLMDDLRARRKRLDDENHARAAEQFKGLAAFIEQAKKQRVASYW